MIRGLFLIEIQIDIAAKCRHRISILDEVIAQEKAIV